MQLTLHWHVLKAFEPSWVGMDIHTDVCMGECIDVCTDIAWTHVWICDMHRDICAEVEPNDATTQVDNGAQPIRRVAFSKNMSIQTHVYMHV